MLVNLRKNRSRRKKTQAKRKSRVLGLIQHECFKDFMNYSATLIITLSVPKYKAPLNFIGQWLTILTMICTYNKYTIFFINIYKNERELQEECNDIISTL
jgi:hypothetical protein